MLPLAIQYGMTPEQFYNSTPDVFYAYEKAYITRIHQEAYINGLYQYDAFSIALSNAFRGKGQKAIEYHKEPVYSPYSKKNIEDRQMSTEEGSKMIKEKIRKKNSFWKTMFHKRKDGGN